MPVTAQDLAALGSTKLAAIARELTKRRRLTSRLEKIDRAIESIVAGKGDRAIERTPSPAPKTDATPRHRRRAGKKLIRPIDVSRPVPMIVAQILRASGEALSIAGLVHEVLARMPGLVKRVGKGRAGDIVTKVVRASERLEIAKDGTVTLKASPAAEAKAVKLKKSAARAKAKGSTFRQLVTQELKRAGRPLHAKDLAARLVDRGFKPVEKTRPFIHAIHSPLGAMMKEGLVKRTAPGTFALPSQAAAS